MSKPLIASCCLALFALLLVVASCERAPVQAQEVPVAPSKKAAHQPSVNMPKERSPNYPKTLDLPDRGIWKELDSQIKLEFPSWLRQERFVVMRHASTKGVAYAYLDGTFIGAVDPESVDPKRLIVVEGWGDADRDGDLIPDQLDWVIGAQKTEINAAPYKGGYQKLAYPGGDVPRTEGVCTDVVVRALRNAGIDLQKELHEDIKRSPKSFRMVKRPDRYIDHRRVKTLLPYFKRQWRSLPLGMEQPWLPGDILFMQTMGDKRPDHLGITSPQVGSRGVPLVTNNWTHGYATKAMDVAGLVPLTHRFRHKPPKRMRFGASHKRLEGVLKHAGLKLPKETTQAILVTAPYWSSDQATLRLFERGPKGWRQEGKSMQASLGAKGFGAGQGPEVPSAWPATMAYQKREGDKRSPAGVFRLGTAFGKQRPSKSMKWPWRQVSKGDCWSDDPRSSHYNRWTACSELAGQSREELTMYSLGLVVEHNLPNPKAGAGSAIFMHTRGKKHEPTLGCTALPAKNLKRILRWLDPAKQPRLVQLPTPYFE